MTSPDAPLRARDTERAGRPAVPVLGVAGPPSGPEPRALPASWRSGWPAFVLTCTARATLLVLLWLVGWSLLPAAIGWEATVVVSGSMAPRIHVGDVVVARPVADDQLRTGMVLLVDDPDHAGRLRLHRLVGVEDGLLRLRGDANTEADSTLVARTAVHGAGVLLMPAIGRPLLWWSAGDVVPLLCAGAGLALLAGAATLHQRSDGAPRTPTAPRRRAHRPARRTHGLRSPSGGRLPARRTGSAHRLRSRYGRMRVVMAVTGLLTALLVVLTATSSAAGYRATTTQGTDSWGSNRHYTCAEAAASPAAQLYYPLQETAGTVAADAGTAGTSGDGTFQGGVTLARPGPACSGASSAVQLDGVDDLITSSLAVTSPNTFSLESWINTTTAGGMIMGFHRDGGTGRDDDRMVYMGNLGRLSFGLQPTTTTYQTVRSTKAYDDGRWHHVVATQGSSGMAMYVDGAWVAGDPTYTTGFDASGTWRIGRGQTNGWPFEPSNGAYRGLIAHAAVYTVVLTPDDVLAHYRAGR